MATIRKEQQKDASQFMKVFWNEIVKPYYNPEDSDEWWNKFLDRTTDIAKNYCGTDRRLHKILVGFAEGLEQEARRL